MFLDVQVPMLTSNHSLCNNSLRARNKIAHVELFARRCKACAAICCDCNLWKPRTQYTEKIVVRRKNRARSKNQFLTMTLGKLYFITQYRMRYTIYIPVNTKDLTIYLAMLVYENGQNAIKFAQANNPELLRALKHLVETRLNKAQINL